MSNLNKDQYYPGSNVTNSRSSSVFPTTRFPTPSMHYSKYKQPHSPSGIYRLGPEVYYSQWPAPQLAPSVPVPTSERDSEHSYIKPCPSPGTYKLAPQVFYSQWPVSGDLHQPKPSIPTSETRYSSTPQSNTKPYSSPDMNHITPLPPSSFNFETRDRYSGTLQLRSKPGLSPGRYKLSPEAFYAQWPSHNLLQLTPSIHDFETRDYYSDYPDNPQSHATHSEDFEHDFCDEDNMMEKTDDINWHHGILCRGDLESRCFKSKEDICINNPYSDACGVLKAVCSNKVNYKKLLSLESSAAQLALDVMQMILDQSVTYSLGSAFEHILLKAMLRLSKRSTLYPRSYILTNVKRDEYPIASGHFGEVFRGDYNGRNVALKVFKLYANEMSRINDMLKAFFKEAILWRHLVHRNLLPFYGIYQLGDSGGRMCLVSPWMDNGNITQYLGRNPDVSRQHLTLDIARGIAYLHEKSIVHGDLKGVNVLISDNGVACLADFGLSSIINTYSLAWSSIESSVINAGTVRWQAPELLDEKSLGATKESDIYAFACVCYEVFVGKVPFYQCPFDPTVMRQIMLGQRPLRPELNSTPYIRWGLTQWMWSLIEECWREDASIRPQASEVVYKLSSRKEFLRGDAQNQDDSWGDLRPEVFRSLTDQRPSMSKEDVQCFMSLLKSL